MRNSNKVLIAAVAAALLIFLAFILVMGLTVRELLESNRLTATRPQATSGLPAASRLPAAFGLPSLSRRSEPASLPGSRGTVAAPLPA
jgi:hypothetical protein